MTDPENPDAGASGPADMRAFCRTTGHALLSVSEKDGVLSFLVQKRAKAAPGATAPDTSA